LPLKGDNCLQKKNSTKKTGAGKPTKLGHGTTTCSRGKTLANNGKKNIVQKQKTNKARKAEEATPENTGGTDPMAIGERWIKKNKKQLGKSRALETPTGK